MRTDRRGFARVLTAAFAWLAGGPARAVPPTWTCEIHEQTRNGLLGPVGREWWPTRRSARRTKAYAGRERIALPAPKDPGALALAQVVRDFRPADGFRDGPLALPELSRLLHFTNGITGPPILRAAPSAGALYAGEVYVVVEQVTGLAPGVYYYPPPEHSLVRLSRGSEMDAVRRALERPDRIAGASAVILLTNVFGRYGWRYANRGYRYALIDTGHIGENLRLAARSTGLVDIAPLRFHDDRLNDLLGVDGRGEAVCAMHAVGRRRAGTRSSPAQRAFTAAGDAPTAWSDPERYHAATRLVEGAQPPPPERVSPRARDVAAETLRPDMSVEDCIRNRRSANRFADRPIHRDALEWVLETAAGNPALARTGNVDLLLAVHRVEGLAPGLYRYGPAGRLVPLRTGDLRGPLVRACLGQEKAGACAAAVFGVGSLRRAIESAGDRVYRDLLIEAGGIGQRIYLAAEAARLAARNLAAFRDDDLNRLLDLDGHERAVVHLTLVGREGEP